MPIVIDGNKIAAELRERVAADVGILASRSLTPGLAVILVGDDPASHSYVTMKERDCDQVGIRSYDLRRPAGISQHDLEVIIDECNQNPDIHGILLQMPLPPHLDSEAAIARIDPTKDVDGFHPFNLGQLLRGRRTYRPCTPSGVMHILDYHHIALEGKHAVVVGRSTIVGKPMAMMLLERNSTVTVCHSRTVDLPSVCRSADILVAAVGRANMITAEFIKPGAVVIDVGINRVESGMVGDVDYDSVAQIASAITPVPGGVGPMTRAMLLVNTVEAANATIHPTGP